MTWPCARVCRALPCRAVLPPARSVKLLRAYSVEGVVLASSELPDGFADAFLQAGLPVVHAFGRTSQSRSVNMVGIDNHQAGRGAAATRQVQQPPATGWRGDQINAVEAIAFAVRHFAPITIRVIHRQYQGLAESAVSVGV